MSKPFISIVCAVHNSENTLLRMLDSIANQTIDHDLLEIIVVDDCSTDNSCKILYDYRHNHLNLHLSIMRTSEDSIHCPANTRQYGLNAISGEWVLFIDGDDILARDACEKFMNYALNNLQVGAMVKSEIDQVSSDGVIFLSPYPTNVTLLHDNFYSKRFIDEYNIQFSPDMKLFEDIYFNSLCISNVMYHKDPNIDFGYIPDITYHWTFNTSSLSSELMRECKGHVELYLIDDWIKASFDPFEQYLHIWPVPNVELFKTRLRQVTSGLYYYFENGLYRRDLDNIDKDIMKHAEDSIHIFFNKLNKICTNALHEDIDSLLYTYPEIFCEQYFAITNTNNYFVPSHSYKDFVKLMQ